MNKGIKKILAGIISAGLLAGVCKADERSETEFELLTDVHASIEAAGVSGGDYRLKTARELHFDVLRVNEWFIHIGLQENSLFDYSPSQIDHTIEYIGVGRETGSGRIKFFWEHTCNNPSRKLPAGEKNEIRWNEMGIGYETTGMRFGHENDGIKFDSATEWLNKINWGASVSRIWMRHDNDYDYMFKGGIRNDVVRIGNQVFYAQFKVNAIYDDRGVNWNPAVEAGDRIRLGENVCIVPFVSYEHFHDWYGIGADEDFFFYGLRLEASLDEPKNTPDAKDNRPAKEALASPDEQPVRFHVSGGYNVNLSGTNKKCRSSDVGIDLDVAKLDDKVVTINTYAGILTEPGAFEVQNINYRIGPSLEIELAYYRLRFFHSYGCLYGVENEGLIRSYNLIGAEVSRDEQLSWGLRGAVYPSTTNFDYSAEFQGMAGYEFYNDKGITPYINGSLNCLLGDDTVCGNAVEGGLKFPGKAGEFTVYLRRENDFDVFRFGEGNQTWFGFRFEF